MKPILYTEDEMTFTNNGIGILSSAISCYVTSAINGVYELEMKYPVKGIHYSDVIQRAILFAKAGPKAGKQPFRIYRISKPIGGVVTVYARHVAYDMMGIPVSPFTAENAVAAMAAMTDNAAVDCPFTLYTEKTTEAAMKVTAPTAMWSLLGGTEGSVLDCYGGEYEFDRWTVRLWERLGEDRGVSIRYGKNLTSLEQDENCAGCYTGVYPYWQNADGSYVELTEKVVNAPGTYSYTRILPLDLSTEWAEEPTEDQLRTQAEKYIADNDIGTPAVSWKIEFVQLEQTEEYKNVLWFEEVVLGDTVAVEFADMGISASARAVEVCYDTILERYVSVTLGKVRPNLADIVVNQQKELQKKPSSKAVGLTIQTLTAGILGAKGGSVRFLDEDGDGQPDTLYIADKADPDTATKVWRFNYEGWGASQNGYNGPFILGATIDGGFIADWITAGKLSSADGNSYFDLDAGEIVTNNITATGGTIGGCSIVDGKLQVPAANITGKLTASQINADGISASNATISGKITATSGAIAGWTITSGTIRSGDESAGTGVAMKSGGTYAFVAGSDNFSDNSNAKFRVKHTGEVYATAGAIGGCNIVSGKLQVPAAQITGKLTASQINADGITASNVSISGKITATNGAVGDWNVGEVTAEQGTASYSGNAIYSDAYTDVEAKTETIVYLFPKGVCVQYRDSSGNSVMDFATWRNIVKAANA